ncbi:MAG TPA: D-alanyl-D-alanine carboxypeptidase family protein [Patescibacteria group bacterium]|nr:D-alanyl-D-alanine carboxypeptidase family protein [Patescibacteria group bacterium]
MNFPSFSLSKLKLNIRPKRLSFSLMGFLAILVFLLIGRAMVKTPPKPALTLRGILGFRTLLPTPAPYPVNKKVTELPTFSARSVIALDVNSMVPLYEEEADQKLFPASTTKIMTALVALEHYPLDQILTVGRITVSGNLIKLLPGERITVENLLYGILVGSGNDATLVLAENFPGGTGAFVEAMNQKAKDLRLDNTHFVNPIGLDETGHYSTARDLARLTQEAVKNPIFVRIVSTSAVAVSDVSGEINHFLKNTNELVGKLEGVKGVKTGWTQNAGECLIALTERNGEKVVTVVLGSQDRFGETQKLIEWIFTNFSWETVKPKS